MEIIVTVFKEDWAMQLNCVIDKMKLCESGPNSHSKFEPLSHLTHR